MARVTSFLNLPNRDLLEETRRLAANERSSSAALIAALAEVDGRRLYLSEGYSCMFHYCTDSLHLSESAAYKRIEVARVSRAFPQILDALERGALNVSTAVVIAPHLTTRNVDALIEAASFKRKKEVERLVAARHPKPDVPTIVRKQPTPQGSQVAGPGSTASFLAEACTTPDALAAAAPEAMAATAVPEAATSALGTARTTAVPAAALAASKPAVIAPLSPTRYKIQFTADQDTHDKLRHAQALLRHQIPNGDIGALINKALTLLIADVERKKLGIVKRPRTATAAEGSGAAHTGSRTIPAAVKRAVAMRDGGRCAFVGRDGRCGERGFLEFHHVVPYAAGGKATIDNIALRCKAHNGHEAVLYFGEAAPPRRARADSG